MIGAPVLPRSMRVVALRTISLALGSPGEQLLGGGLKVCDAPLDVGNPAGAHDVHGEHAQERHVPGSMSLSYCAPVLAEDAVSDIVDLIFYPPVVSFELEKALG